MGRSVPSTVGALDVFGPNARKSLIPCWPDGRPIDPAILPQAGGASSTPSRVANGEGPIILESLSPATVKKTQTKVVELTASSPSSVQPGKAVSNSKASSPRAALPGTIAAQTSSPTDVTPGSSRKGSKRGDAVGALLPGKAEGKPTRPIIKWNGRWGKWGEDHVHVAAPYIATFQVTLNSAAESGKVARSVQECIRRALRAELREEPPSRMVIAVHKSPRADNQYCAALICRKSMWEQLKQIWQDRKLNDGRYSVTWLTTKDTTHQDHVTEVKAESADKFWADTVSFQVPRLWAFNDTPPASNVAPLLPGTHWHEFVSIFGDVAAAEFVWESQFEDTVWLVARFRSGRAPATLYEMLAGRYLWNPMTYKKHKKSDDAHPIICILGDWKSLRERARTNCVVEPAASPVPGKAKEAISVNTTPKVALPPVFSAPAAAPSLMSSMPPVPAAPAPVPLPTAPTAHVAPVVSDHANSIMPTSHAISLGSSPVWRLIRQNPFPGMTSRESEITVTLDKHEYIVGREVDCDLMVTAVHVSRHHAKIYVRQESISDHGPSTLCIRDMSTNGVNVNERRISKSAPHDLMPGDTVAFDAAGRTQNQIPTYIVHKYPNLVSYNAAVANEPKTQDVISIGAGLANATAQASSAQQGVAAFQDSSPVQGLPSPGQQVLSPVNPYGLPSPGQQTLIPLNMHSQFNMQNMPGMFVQQPQWTPVVGVPVCPSKEESPAKHARLA